jgi:methionyl aminopeptidase
VIPLKTAADVDAIAEAGAILARLFDAIRPQVKAGNTTLELDRFAEDFIRSHPGAEPAFKGLYGFPATLCISLNHEVVHGIPRRNRVLKEGDIVSVDAGVRLNGWYADAAVTYPVGEIDIDAARLLDVTQTALKCGIETALAGNRLGDIGHAVQQVAEGAGFSVVREYVGHGIGRSMHEDPQIPNYGEPGRGPQLKPGLVVAVEPMVNVGGWETRVLADDWTVVTADGALSAHFEHTIAVTEDGPEVLTARR